MDFKAWDVTAYGAIGGGQNDDAPGINEAIRQCSAAGGGIVYMPGQTYYLGSGPIFNSAQTAATVNNVCLQGSMRGATTITANPNLNGGAADLIRILIPTNTPYASRLAIRDLTLDCTNQGPNGNGVTLVGVNNLLVERVATILPKKWGVFIGSNGGFNSGNGYVQNVTVRDCEVYGAVNDDAFGGGGIQDGLFENCRALDLGANYTNDIDLTNITNVTFLKCLVRSSNPAAVQGGFRSDFGSKRCKWIACEVEGMGYGFIIDSQNNNSGQDDGRARDIEIAHCSVNGVAHQAFDIAPTASAGFSALGVNIHDNAIASWDGAAAGAPGIQIFGGQDIDIHDNKFGVGHGGYLVQIFGDTGGAANPPSRVKVHDNDPGTNTSGFYCVIDAAGTAKFSNNYGQGAQPFGQNLLQAAPALAASGTPMLNATGADCTVYVSGGTVTVISLTRPGGGAQVTGLTSGAIRVAAGESITITYSAAPTVNWFGD